MFWTALSAPDQAAVRAIGTERSYEAGSTLAHEGELPTHTMVILDGRVKVGRDTADGKERIIELRSSGDLIGELGLFDDRPRIAKMVAVDEVRVLVIDAKRFLELLAERGTIAVVVLASVSEKLRQATDRRLSWGTSDTLTKVSGRLVELAGNAGNGSGEVVEIRSPFTQQELAEWVGVSREAIVLALRELRNRGVIETGRRTIRLLDIDQLRAIATDVG